jgi:hypothetical protein
MEMYSRIFVDQALSHIAQDNDSALSGVAQVRSCAMPDGSGLALTVDKQNLVNAV